MKIQKDWYDQAPLGLGVGCRVSGVGEDTAPTTQGSQAPSFQDDDIGGGSKPTPMLSSLHPNPYPQHPVVDGLVFLVRWVSDVYQKVPKAITHR